MLRLAYTETRRFIASNETIRDLNLYRNKEEKNKQIKIGWRFGSGMSTTRPSAGGVVDCPQAPSGGTCPESSYYTLKIDRMSHDLTKVYARYSFEIVFPSNGVFTVYFEGCCRQEGLGNNEKLTFHVRSEVVVSADATLPKSSVRFAMPDTVVLRQVTPQVDAMNCAEDDMQRMSRCAGDSCKHKFALQALHPDSAFRSRIEYRLADAYEMGRYKCLERSDLQDPTSAMALDPELCENRVLVADFVAPPGLDLADDPGQMQFRVDKVGRWAATVVAVCQQCAGGGADLLSVIDFGLEVVKAWGLNNWQPPYAWYGDTASLRGRSPPPAALLGVTPLSAFGLSQYPPLQIQCGRQAFRMETVAGAVLWSAPHVRIAYTDDFIVPKATCGQGIAQSIAVIKQSTDLPKGVELSEIVRKESEQDAASAYIDLTWRPQCEDSSQVCVCVCVCVCV